MSRLAIALIAVCGIGAAGCQSASSPDGTDTRLEQGSVTPILHEVYTNFGQPARLVVRDARLWGEVWDRVFAGRTEVPQLPAIDFSQEMVVVAAQGGQPSSGYDISIERVSAGDGIITVQVTTTSPHRRCGVLTVITAPVMMVRIPRSESNVQFRERARIVPCD